MTTCVYGCRIVYSGSSTIVDNENTGIGKSGAIVQTLMKPYLGKGHTLFVDNRYTSPALFNLLHNNRTNACGTVRQRRSGIPKTNERLKKGEATFRSSNNLLFIKSVDKREVYMLSTMHTVDFVTVSRRGGNQVVQKPVCVIDYNNSMGTVDRADMVARHNLVKVKKRSKRYYDQKINPQVLKVEDEVFLLKESTLKFGNQNIDPHKILEMLPHNNIKLQVNGKTKIFNCNKLRKSKISQTSQTLEFKLFQRRGKNISSSGNDATYGQNLCRLPGLARFICTGTQYVVPYSTWNDIVMQESVKINLEEYFER
ncbi:uncharacterized protein LOC118445666 [Vespa mandarinia]|uniref:uncharacterized protein LOC118445666 n=1 Tax=Vespa mandarinia TaxID=7446 RepID=UPI001619DF20|nr:uncharacterized protein LOC118445666 [Vespa mandarinia]